MGPDMRALRERVWTLFSSWHLSPSRIDRELCLVEGTAKRIISKRWEGQVA